MSRSRTCDPLGNLTRSERRAWRATERRLRRDHEDEQLAALLGMAAAGDGVTVVTTPQDEDGRARPAPPVEMIIAGRRLRAARVQRRALSKLRDALSPLAAVPLTAAGRYGPYWVLTFRLATEQLVLLVDQLTLLPDWGAPGGRDGSPVRPLARMGA